MNVPKDLQQFVGEQLSLGNYESLDDLLTEALTLLKEKRRIAFLEEIDIGRRQIENGDCIELKTESEVDEFFESIGRREPGNPAEPAA